MSFVKLKFNLSKIFFAVLILNLRVFFTEADLTSSLYFGSIAQDDRITEKPHPKTIAIVGGGIGGTSSSFFMRQLFGKNVDIHVYESSDRLCGRVSTVTVENHNYESGASIIHGKNLYAKTAAESFGLENAVDLDKTSSFFDGKDYVLQTSSWSIITLLKFLWAFGLNFFQLSWMEKNFMDKFLNVYELHRLGYSYSSVEDLLAAVSGDEFINATQISSCQFFKENNFRNPIIDILVNGGLRNNYGQSCAVNGFVGMVSMAGIQPGLWSVKGGNKRLCEKFMEHSNSKLFNEEVKKVSKQPEATSFTVSSDKSERFYDIVVIATPINRDKSHIDVTEAFSGKGTCPSAITDPRHYHTTIATFVKGKLNSTLFNCDSPTSCPGAIFTVKDLFYNSIGLHVPVDFDPDKGSSINDSIYKVFSSQTLTDQQLSMLFESRAEKTEVRWKAYPQYSPPEQLDGFVLNEDGLYYTSPIEWVSSAIEMSLISAKNIALLAFNKWYDIPEKIDVRLSDVEHTEL